MDAIQPNGNPVILTGSDGSSVKLLRQVIFVTRTLSAQNARLQYRTIQEFFDPTYTLGGYLVAAVDNAKLGSLDPGTIPVGFNSDQNTGTTIQGNSNANSGSLLNSHSRQPSGNTDNGNIKYIVNSIVSVDGGGNVTHRQTVTDPTWFKEFEIAGIYHFLLADANGVYQIRLASLMENGTATEEAVVEWALTNDDYLYLTGRPLKAAAFSV